MDSRLKGSLIEMDRARSQKQNVINNPLRRQVTIDILPEDVLLEIFDCYVAEANKVHNYEEWQMLVHVCQKWRYVVFWSPLRLDIQLLCSAGTPVREKLAVWPPLPVIIKEYGSSTAPTSKCGQDNIIAALEHNDRVCEIRMNISGSLLESVFAAMQKTFVALNYIWLYAIDDRAPVVSDSFLGGSAPHLRRLWLRRIPFPFPVSRKLPLSAPNLVTLSLLDIPHSGYVSPEAMVTCLSAFTRLEDLCIGFQSPQSRPPRESRRPWPTRTRSILPALTMLQFVGVSEYLEDLVTRIDAPLLNHLAITFFYQLIFNTPQLVQFIGRTPKFKVRDKALVDFSDSRAAITLLGRDNYLRLAIICKQSDWQLSSLAQFFTSFPQALILVVERLFILERYGWPRSRWQDDIEYDQWLELFHPFTTVKDLYLHRNFLPRIVPTLQELVGERVTEVLPNLQCIFLEDPLESEFVPEAMRQFIAARQLSDRPIAISHWRRQDV